MTAGTIRDYISYGTLAARPASPAITALSGGSARYYATDTKTDYAWDGSAWQPAGIYDAVATKSANYIIVAADNRSLLIANAASLVFTLPAPATAGAGWSVTIKNNGQTTTGIKTNAAGVLIDGVDCSSTAFTGGLTTTQGAVKLQTDGTAFYSVAMDSVSGGGGGSGLYSAYLCYQDQKTANTTGGTFTSGAWRTRDLNTEVADSGNNGSVATNQMTLAAGTYDVLIRCPAFDVGVHQARLQNITDTTTLCTGNAARTDAASTVGNDSIIQGRFTIAASKVIEVQHYCVSTQATNGFGPALGQTIEVFTSVQLWKV